MVIAIKGNIFFALVLSNFEVILFLIEKTPGPLKMYVPP